MPAHDINIPPEAIEAAARALAIENETREDWWRFYEGKARAACLAMLRAWPGAIHNGHWLLFPHTKLPLTQEASDE